MKNLWTKITTLVLALLMVISCFAFVACSNDTPEEPDEPGTDPVEPGTDPDTDPDTEPEEDPNAPVDYIMSIPQQNYGKEYVMLSDVGKARLELYIEDELEAAGDTVDTAIFYRNNRVEEHLGVTLASVTAPGDYYSSGIYISFMRQSYQTGDQNYQLASCYEAYAAEGAIAGYYYDVSKIDAVDLTAPWHVPGWNDTMSINGHSYMILTDLSLSMWQRMNVLYFNKQLSGLLGITDTLYTLATDGDWTLATMMEYASQIAKDDGNDTWDDKDTYGACFNTFNLRSLSTYFDMPMSKRNDFGDIELCWYNERTEEIFGAMHSYLFDENYVYKNIYGSDDDYSLTAPMFTEDRLLFLPSRLQVSQEYLRQMEGEFGILPIPKYDENQESYRTHADDNMNVFFIPSHTDDAEFCGTVLEALSAENKYSVISTYYDVVLKGRTTKDDESGRMMDIARDNLHFDFIFGHITVTGFMFSAFGAALENPGVSSFKPSYDSAVGNWEKLLGDVLEKYWDIR